MMKKIYLFAIALIVAGFLNTAGGQVIAAESSVTICDDYIVEKYDAETANIYIGESAPSQPEGYTGWIFSGWYTNAECTKAIRENGVTTECYAKFVPEEVLSVKCQTKVVAEGTETITEKSNLRFVTSIDSTYYSKAGFDISRDGKTYKNETNTSYKRIIASPESGVSYEYSPKVFDTDSESFITYTITNIPEGYYDTEFLVKPYWITMDNVKVYGVSRYVAVNDYKNSVVNIPIKVTASDTKYTTADFHVYEGAKTTAESESVSVRYRTGEDYASIILSGKTGLLSATKYTAYNSDETSLLTTFVHRNYNTAYANTTSTVDFSWYTVANEVNSSEDEYVLVTSADLYGFSSLSQEYNFSKKTVYVVADITVNEGDASTWGTTAQSYAWSPIGRSTAFAGRFSGEGHTISGLYNYANTADSKANQGLFGKTTVDARIENIRLANTYFASIGNAMAGIAGQGGGTFDSIYVEDDVYLSTTGQYAGGIIGKLTLDTTIINCWFAGEVTSTDIEAGGIIGRVDADAAATLNYCLNTGKVYGGADTSKTYSRAAGMCGVIAGSGSLTLNNCLNTGSIDGNSLEQTGSLVGYASGSLTIKDTCATNESCTINEEAVAVGKSNTTASGYTLYAEEDIQDEGAYNTNLQFDDSETTEYADGHWLAMVSSTPVLKTFAESNAYYMADTRWYDGTKGTEENPYIIKTVAELYGLAEIVNGGETLEGIYIQLGQDITVNMGNAEDWAETAALYVWNAPIGNGLNHVFAGNFDGAGYTISGLYHATDNNNVALFGCLGANAVIKNVNIENTYFSGKKAVAAIAGQGGKTFENISVGDDVILVSAMNMCGGIIGKLTMTTGISNCEVAAVISAGVESDTSLVSQAGGLVGIVSTGSAEIDSCRFSGSVTASGLEAGGIIGQITTYANITNCYVTAEATILAAKGEVAGIVGDITSSDTSTIKYCLNAGTVKNSLTNSGNARTGAICGVIGSYSIVEIDNCFNIGTFESVRTIQLGIFLGYIGSNAQATLDDSYSVTCSISNRVGKTAGTCTYNISAFSEAVLSSENLTGENAYNNTWLEFDDASKEALFDGHWVITDATPMLRSFVEGDITYPSSIKADTRWYDSAETSFTIYTAEELYGLASLVDGGTSFEECTVSLGANIIVNSGEAAEWGENVPAYIWSVIGNNTGKMFTGTFDGCSYTISGLYYNDTNYSNIGLFSATTSDTVIENVTIKNTYFRGNKAIGAVVGQGGGSFDTIHIENDVYLESNGNWCGGIIGLIKTSDSVTSGTSEEAHTFNNCWFEGTIRAERYGGGMTGSVGKFEDDTTAQARYASNATITNCLNTGTIIHTGVSTGKTTARTGGLVGAVVSDYNTSSKEATLVSNLIIEDCFCAGSVSSEISDAGQLGSVVGQIFNGSEITCTDVYATRECSASSYIANSNYVDETNVTITRHFEEQMKGLSGYVNTSGLVYDNVYLATAGSGTWVAVCGDYPVLKSFSDGYTAVDFSPFVLEGSVVADMVNQGGGNAVITVSGDYRTDYLAKIAGDGGLGFEPCYSNSVGSDDKSISTSSYKKDDLVITVTYVAGTNTTYISAGNNVEFSKYLSLDTVAKEGGDTTSGEMSLGMLQLENAAGSTYIMQLENGHFIIEDGGQTETDYANFVTYLYELTGGEKPIIDAWIISHAHVDHYGILDYVDSNGDGVADDFYVEGFYYTQASAESSNASKIINRTKLCRTTTEDVPEVYRMYTGQTYYFDGVTMEVLLTHEQLTGYTDFNETSVWCKYTIGTETSAQTFLNGADSSTVGMAFMMNAYSADYLYCDIFAALHHGVNTSTDFTDFLEENSVASGYAVDDVVLYSRMSNPTDASGYLPNDGSDDENGSSNLWDEVKILAQRNLLQSYNNDLIGEVKNGISVDGASTKYMYYGVGTAKLIFTSEGITGSYITE